MFDYLAGKFIKDNKDYKNPKVRLKLISLASMIGIAVNIILVVGKLIVGYSTNSTAIINDGFNNLSDSIVSLMAYIGSKLSQKPADREHPHGHGRVEGIITLLVSIIIMFVGFKLFNNSLNEFKHTHAVKISTISLLILLVSIAFKLYIYLLNRKLYIKLDSDLNHGVMLDSRNDIIATASIILVSFIERYVDFNIDAMLGVVLAGFVFMPGLDLFRNTFKYLMGESLNPDVERRVGEIILDNDFIVGYHDLQFHEYGRGHLDGSVDVEIAQNLSLLVAHQIITNIQKRIKKELGINLSIHMDPTYTLIVDKEIKKEIYQLEEKATNDYEDFNPWWRKYWSKYNKWSGWIN